MDGKRKYFLIRSNCANILFLKSPESLRSANYSTKSDVWSFGILCWEVLSGKEPHLDADPLTVGVAIRDQGLTPDMNDEWDPALISLMKDCWKVDPEQRPVRTKLGNLVLLPSNLPN